jgi:hypothetical protein
MRPYPSVRRLAEAGWERAELGEARAPAERGGEASQSRRRHRDGSCRSLDRFSGDGEALQAGEIGAGVAPAGRRGRRHGRAEIVARGEQFDQRALPTS